MISLGAGQNGVEELAGKTRLRFDAWNGFVVQEAVFDDVHDLCGMCYGAVEMIDDI